MQNQELHQFVVSHSMKSHPLEKARKKTKVRYYVVLEYLINRFANDAEYANAQLSQYRKMLLGNENAVAVADEMSFLSIPSSINDWCRSWKLNYCIWLMCDVALIVADRNAIEKAYDAVAVHLSKKKRALLGQLVAAFFTNKPVRQDLIIAKNWIHQFRANRTFASKPELRILITANMSAGKSTLINALVGKSVVRTSQEACTANLCYLFNKPFEDNSVHLSTPSFNINATYDDLMNAGEASSHHIASYFRSCAHSNSPQRICLIDTPGVNSAINREHGERTRKALLEEQYDKLIYVLNANRLGTDDEIRYLKYVSEHVPQHKVLFVLNKVDDFKSADDSIAASIAAVRHDLLQLGYDNPVLFPLSAYFALLLKLKQHGDTLSEDEQDVYDYYVKKFSRAAYDLSAYSHESATPVQSLEDERTALAIRCGLYGLENNLYGGITYEKYIPEVQPIQA